MNGAFDWQVAEFELRLSSGIGVREASRNLTSECGISSSLPCINKTPTIFQVHLRDLRSLLRTAQALQSHVAQLCERFDRP